jgi:hypothetical protein
MPYYESMDSEISPQILLRVLSRIRTPNKYYQLRQNNLIIGNFSGGGKSLYESLRRCAALYKDVDSHWEDGSAF